MSQSLENRVVEVLRTIYDPEIPVDIYELGLIYKVTIDEEQRAHVLMTLTSPMCPVAESLPPEVKTKVAEVEGVTAAEVEVTWDPPWDPEMMSEAARLELGML
ncbi:MAG: SUF system Fe-S cluster assembly protein [bacterium]|nr:SUF system Fe-S cluster assembly protein [bacterium]